MRNNDIMNLDIKIGYEEILKNEKVLEDMTIGQLKGIHYKLHKTYNLKTIRRDIQILVYRAHNLLLKRFEKYDLEHKLVDKLDIQLKRRPLIEKKPKNVNKRKVFLLRKSVKKIG
jgi:hypothetical protein